MDDEPRYDTPHEPKEESVDHEAEQPEGERIEGEGEEHDDGTERGVYQTPEERRDDRRAEAVNLDSPQNVRKKEDRDCVSKKTCEHDTSPFRTPREETCPTPAYQIFPRKRSDGKKQERQRQGHSHVGKGNHRQSVLTSVIKSCMHDARG